MAGNAIVSGVSMFFGLNRTLEVGDGGVTFDAFVSEEHSKNLTMTQIPVEDGSIINDHSIMMPRKLQIRAIRSNTPIFYGGGLLKGENPLGNQSALEWASLIEVLEEREPLKIVTLFEVYESMVLTDIATVTDKDNSKSLLVDMTFQEFRAVQIKEEQMTASQIADDATASQASQNESKGQKPTEASNDTILRGLLK